MLLRVRATSLSPTRLYPPGLAGSTFYGLWATDVEGGVTIYMCESAGTPTLMDCLCGKELAPGAQNQSQNPNGAAISNLHIACDPADAPVVGSTISAGALVFNSALNCRARITADFDVPAVNANVTVSVPNTALSVTKSEPQIDIDGNPVRDDNGDIIYNSVTYPLLAVDDEISIGAGLYQMVSIADGTTFVAKYLGAAVGYLTPFG